MAKVTTPRERWVDEGLRALAAGGPQTVRVEALAKELGVTKGGFYWHFADRRALLDAMLDAWEQEGVDEPITQVDAAGGDGRARLHELFAIALAAADRLPIELAIRDWARRDPSVHARVARVDNRRMDYMRQLFSDFCEDPADVEARCFLVFSMFVGQSFVAASHGSRSRADVVRAALEYVLA
ncbi:MAG TPA: TetR/AcrR family transcriptional regulator [Aeromicrobium sp.]|nr:TetR/AcrR family transcriptional regulator [Aeromicrobium sp.]